jgi:uncharacterized protein (TIGR02611 family)
MGRGVKLVRKFVAAVVGFPLLILGIVLIPIPGPGLLICFLALLILSLEFDFANSHYEKAKAGIKRIYDEAKARADRISKK